MPIAKARLDRMISMIDSEWQKRKENEDTDPKQFLEEERKGPVAEPPTMPQEDSAPSHIHAGKKDLFK
jgi:hypothetical protein